MLSYLFDWIVGVRAGTEVISCRYFERGKTIYGIMLLLPTYAHWHLVFEEGRGADEGRGGNEGAGIVARLD